jgi:hypothetical protein
MRTLRRYLGDDDLREALDRASAGIFDPRSWSYWRLVLDRAPAGIFDPRSWSYWHLVLDRWPPLLERMLPYRREN